MSEKKQICSKCGKKTTKISSKIYWIEYYVDKKRKRERIGRSKQAAQNRLRAIQTAIAEAKYIDIDQSTKITLQELSVWYLNLDEVKAKKSYSRDRQLVTALLNKLDGAMVLRDLNIGLLENYIAQRKRDKSSTFPDQCIKPATINKEIGCLKGILNKAVNYQKLSNNPLLGLKKIPEDNVRARVLKDEEYLRLIDCCPSYLKLIVAIGYYQGMRQDEIISLTWDKVDLKEGFIRLKAEDTKTDRKRSIPIHPTVEKLLRESPRFLHFKNVCLKNGKPITGYHGNIRRDYVGAVNKAGLGDFTFHDLRHCAVNNLRLAGNDFFTIMAISGHTTTKTFKRYNLVTEEELRNVAWKKEIGNQ